MGLRRRLHSAQAVLTMDAGEAIYRALVPYLKLFKRWPRAMRAMSVGVVAGPFALICGSRG
jgi:hypothetical protein